MINTQFNLILFMKENKEDLEEYKKNACKILRSQTQCATAKIVEELINQEIMNRRIIEEWDKIYEQFPEYVGM